MWLCTVNHCRDLVVCNLWCDSVRSCLVFENTILVCMSEHECLWLACMYACVWEWVSACLSPLVSYSNWLSKDLKLLDGTCTLRNVESFLLLPQSGTRPGRIRQWCFKDQRKNCHKGCGTWIWPRFLWAFLVSLSKQKWSGKSPKRGVKIRRVVEVGAVLLSRNIEETLLAFTLIGIDWLHCSCRSAVLLAVSWSTVSSVFHPFSS